MKKYGIILFSVFTFLSLNAQIEGCPMGNLCFTFEECTSDSTSRGHFEFESSSEGPWNIFVDNDSIFSSEERSFGEGFIFSNTQYHTITVELAEHPECYYQITIPPIDCSQITDCENCRIWDLFAEAYDPTDDCEFLIDLAFNYANPCSDRFAVLINGEEFIFEYGANFYTVGPFSTEQDIYEIRVVDLENSVCQSEVFRLESPDCEGELCRIWDLRVDVRDIVNDSMFYITLDFNHENTNPAGFDLFWDHQFYGFYSYTDLPLTILVTTRGLEYEYIRIQDNDNEACFGELEFESPVFTEINEKELNELIDLKENQLVILSKKVKEIHLTNTLGQCLQRWDANSDYPDIPLPPKRTEILFISVYTVNNEVLSMAIHP